MRRLVFDGVLLCSKCVVIIGIIVIEIIKDVSMMMYMVSLMFFMKWVKLFLLMKISGMKMYIVVVVDVMIGIVILFVLCRVVV